MEARFCASYVLLHLLTYTHLQGGDKLSSQTIQLASEKSENIRVIVFNFGVGML